MVTKASLRSMVVVVFLVVFGTGALLAGELYVPGTYETIQAAIEAAVDGDSVVVADGVYTGEGNKNLDFGGRAITVKSENGPEFTTIDCENDGRGFYFHDGEDSSSLLDGFTITNGYTNGSSAGGAHGGGISCIDSSPSISNCNLIANAVEGTEIGGGGIYIQSGSPIVSNCLLIDNRCLGNSGDGGGMLISGASVLIENCLFAGNSCPNHGGGGAVRSVDSSATFINCTMADNSSPYPPVEFSHDSVITFSNCIIWNNSWGIWAQIHTSSSELSFSNCDVDGGLGAIRKSNGGTVIDNGDGNIDDDALFVSGPLGGYYLSQVAAGQESESPCVDAGSDLASVLGMSIHTTSTDEVFDSGIVDMGYHYPAWLAVEIKIAPETLNLSSNGRWINCHIWLPEDYDVADVNTNSILLNGQIAPAQVWGNEEGQVVMIKFGLAEVQRIVEAGEVELLVSGELVDGTKFRGTDTIRVIDKGSRGK